MSTRKAATKNGFLIFTDQLALFKNIPDESVGAAIKLLLENFEKMQTINVEPFTNMAYEMIATNVRRYREEQEIATKNGKRGGNPTLNPTLNPPPNPTHKQQDKTRQDNTRKDINKISNNIVNIIETKFKKPTLKEIEDYCSERKNNLDAQYFFDYYESCNWMRGKSRMKDWKATIRTWERNNIRNNNNKTNKEIDGWTL